MAVKASDTVTLVRVNDGTSITTVSVYYYLSTSNTTQTGGSWSTTPPVWADGKYIWSKQKTTLSNGQTSETAPVCITGGKGQTGEVGKSVVSITPEYYLSTSKTTQTGGSWVANAPTWSTGKYMWTRSKIVYSNPTSTSYTTPICDSSWEAVNDLEDKVNEEISIVKKTQANFDVNLKDITSRVETTESEITTVNGDVSSLKTWKSSAEQKITSDAIVSTVTKSSSWSTLNTKATDAQTKANNLVDLTTIKDTRSANNNPQWYFTNYPKKTVKEFKTCTVIGISGESTYGTLVTEVPWTDSSGGYPTQLFYPNNSQNVYRRVGTSTTAWGSWTKVAGSHNITSVINQTADAVKIQADKIDLTGKVTISMLDSSTQTKVNNGNNAMTSINTNKSNWDKGLTAYNWTNSNGTNMTNLRKMVMKWTNNAVSETTTIQGGWIATNTITSAQIATGSIVIGDLDSSTQGKINEGYDNAHKAYWMSMAMSQGQSMYNDPTFLRGLNGLNVYNNSGGTAVKVVREAKASGWSYDTPYRIKVTSNGTTSPGHGGVMFGFLPKAGHTYLFKIIANIPKGRNLAFATNTIGVGGTADWLTKVAGTDAWTEYVCKLKVGTGSIDTTGYFYITGGSTNFSWYIVYANAFDLGTENLISTFTKGTTEIYGDYIKTGSITANKLNVSSLSAITANLGTVTAGSITGVTITGGSITSNTTINVTTNLRVGDDVYVGTNPGNRKRIIFTDNSQIWRWNVSGGEYLRIFSNMRTAIRAEKNGSIAEVAAWVDSGVNKVQITGNVIDVIGDVAASGIVEVGQGKYFQTQNNQGVRSRLTDGSAFEMLYIGTNNYTYLQGKEEVRLSLTNGSSVMYWYQAGSAYTGFFAPSHSQTTLGTTSFRWNQLYCVNNPNVSSDLRLKKNIRKYDERYEKMFMDLKPCLYELKDSPNRTHNGMIAQWVKETMDKYRIKENEFSMYEYDKESDSYSLAYGELTTFNTHMIQKTIGTVDNQGIILEAHNKVISTIIQKSRNNENRIKQLEEQLAEERGKRMETEGKLNALIRGEIRISN